MALVEISDVTRKYDLEGSAISAVEAVNLTIASGEYISIVGHSGSGKTTLLSIMGGILAPSNGTVLVDGVDIYALSDDDLSEYRADKVGYVFQFASLMPVLTARENLLLPTLFTTRRQAGAAMAERALKYLDMVGLADKANAYPSQLSGGQQRRVAIARALMNDPRLLLADEPTGDLDEETEAEVMSVFTRLNREQGITFVLVTHSSEIARSAPRQYRMTGGVIGEVKSL